MALPGRAPREHRTPMPRTLIATTIAITTLMFTPASHAAAGVNASQAKISQASTLTYHQLEHPSVTPAASEPRRIVAAEYAGGHERGCPYVWGGAGPCKAGFDCSGLVMVAYQHAGIRLPHNVAQMVMASGKLHWIPVRKARRGDLAVYGAGWGAYHVALVWHVHHGQVIILFAASTYGVLSGTYRAAGFEPTAYYRVT